MSLLVDMYSTCSIGYNLHMISGLFTACVLFRDFKLTHWPMGMQRMGAWTMRIRFLMKMWVSGELRWTGLAYGYKIGDLCLTRRLTNPMPQKKQVSCMVLI